MYYQCTLILLLILMFIIFSLSSFLIFGTIQNRKEWKIMTFIDYAKRQPKVFWTSSEYSLKEKYYNHEVM